MQTKDPAFEQLAAALEARLAVIGDSAFRERDPDGHLAALRNASEEIGKVASALNPPVDADLAHYLQRASFDKALAWLRAR
jgi:hypothetical protein